MWTCPNIAQALLVPEAATQTPRREIGQGDVDPRSNFLLCLTDHRVNMPSRPAVKPTPAPNSASEGHHFKVHFLLRKNALFPTEIGLLDAFFGCPNGVPKTTPESIIDPIFQRLPKTYC